MNKALLIVCSLLCSVTFASAQPVNSYAWGLVNPTDKLVLVSANEESHFTLSVGKQFANNKASDAVSLSCGNTRFLVAAGTSQRCDSVTGTESTIQILPENFKNGSIGRVENTAS